MQDNENPTPPEGEDKPQTLEEQTAANADRSGDPNDVSSETVNEGEDDERRIVGDSDAPITPLSDPEGKVSNRVEGTIQSEATPEELPADAKVAPLAEQVNPNAAAQAVGALETPDEIAGVEQPEEGEKNVTSDTSDSTKFLSPESEQSDEASRADEDAQRDAERGRV